MNSYGQNSAEKMEQDTDYSFFTRPACELIFKSWSRTFLLLYIRCAFDRRADNLLDYEHAIIEKTKIFQKQSQPLLPCEKIL